MNNSQRLFPLGKIVATPGALDALARAGQQPKQFVDRHASGDWGELDEHDRVENEYSLAKGFRILSSYQTAAGETLWLITEADRSSTFCFFPPTTRLASKLRLLKPQALRTMTHAHSHSGQSAPSLAGRSSFTARRLRSSFSQVSSMTAVLRSCG